MSCKVVRERSEKVPSWWSELPKAEKKLIRDILSVARGAQASPNPKTASAGRKWDRAISCFIKSRLMVQSRHGLREALREGLRAQKEVLRAQRN
jgi:hypothetical protein